MAEDNLKQKTRKGLYWKMAEQFSNYGIQFVIGIAMARMLTPEDYGVTAIPAVFMAIAYIFANAGLGSAMVRKKDLTDEDLSTTFYYSFGVGIFLYAILFFSSPYIADFYNAPVLKSLIRVTALGFLYSPLSIPQSIILQRRIDFTTPAKISVVARILTGIVGVSMAYYGYGVWALTISGMVGGIVNLIITWYVVRWIPKTFFSVNSFRYLWGYGNKLMISELLDTLYNNITPLFIGKYYSPSDLGVYNRAQGYAQMPSQNIHGVINSVTFPVMAKMQDDDERLAYNFRRMLRVTAFIVFPLMMGLAAFAHPLIFVMITSKWEACVIYLQIMCFSMMWWPIHAINLNLLLVKGRSDKFMKLEFIKKGYGLLIMAITLPMGILYFCLAGILSTIVGLLINSYYTGKLYNLGFKLQMKDLSPILILSFCMFIICLSITYIITNLYVQLLIGIPLGIIVYLGGAYFLKFEELEDVKFLLNRRNG